MEPILLFSKQPPLVTVVSNTFIAEYMTDANGSFVKVYLYLAMCMQAGEQALSISSLADRLNNTEADILRALHYWENKKLMKLSYSKSTGELMGITFLDPVQGDDVRQALYPATHQDMLYDKPLPEPISLSDFMPHGTSAADMDTAEDMHRAADTPVNSDMRTAGMHTLSDTHAPSDTHTESDMHKLSGMHMQQGIPKEALSAAKAWQAPQADISPVPKNRTEISVSDEQAEKLASDAEFTWTSHVIESYLSRPLNPKEIQLISYLYGTLKFSSDLLLYLYEYCISLGKTNPNYIQAVALSWDENQVHTPEDAKSASAGYNSTYTAVSKALALGRTLASIEKEYVDRWQTDWGMDLSVILEACNRTMLKISKADFKYTEGILDNWHKSAIHTLQDVKKADEVYAGQKAKRQAEGQRQQGSRNRNQFQAFAQRGTSQSEVDALERKLLMR